MLPTNSEPLSIDYVALAAIDVEAMQGFYRDVVGLTVIGATNTEVVLGVDGRALIVLQHRPDARRWRPHEAGLYHTAILLPSRSALGAFLAHAEAVGQTFTGAADHGVSEAVYLSDPEGNGVEVYADRPASEWLLKGSEIALYNDPLDVDAVRAAAVEPWAGAPPGTTIGHVHLQVGDIDAAEAFWTTGLGMALTNAGRDVRFLSTGGYHHHVAVNTWQSAGAARADQPRSGLAELVLSADWPTFADLSVRHPGGAIIDPWGLAIRLEPRLTARRAA
ncbi:MAG: VOC family protein [Pseudomonadota bacterium]